MRPNAPLPHASVFKDAESYVEALLSFVTTSELFMTLCGGVHVLDFLTSHRDPYVSLIPEDWRAWFEERDIDDIVRFLVSDDLQDPAIVQQAPYSLVNYVQNIRWLCLQREYPIGQKETGPMGMSQNGQTTGQYNVTASLKDPTLQLPKALTVGMKPKKKHEVAYFSSYINSLADYVSGVVGTEVSHLMDLGAGHNYLGRALASKPYSRKIIALERRAANIRVAGELDIKSKLVDKPKPLKEEVAPAGKDCDFRSSIQPGIVELIPAVTDQGAATGAGISKSNIQYFQKEISKDTFNDLLPLIHHPNPALMVISLHSCGNLVHHGLRSITTNSAVRCVALVGCCYNLLTERLEADAPTYKVKGLRSRNERVDRCAATKDEDGFPMSARLTQYVWPSNGHDDNLKAGITFNITARMMACQAPGNWTSQECAGFFTRHFFRALLQRVFLDKGAVPSPEETYTDEEAADRVVIIGSLRASCYCSFVAYVRGATAKMANATGRGPVVAEMLRDLTDEEIQDYETKYQYHKKHLSVMWSLMALSAGVVESVIVVDRWLWLQEQRHIIGEAWVEPVFDYSTSPRNLVVVGVRQPA